MFDATREEGDRDRKREIGGRRAFKGAREALKAPSRDVDTARVRRTLSRIAMFYIIIPAAIRGRSAHRKTSRMEQTQWNCHNTL